MLQKTLMALANGFSWVAGAFVVVIMGLTTVDVIGRKLFQHSIPGVLEINILLLVATAFLGAAAAEWSGRHVEVVLFTSRLKGVAANVAASLRLVVIVAVVGCLIWASALAAVDSFGRGEFTNGILGVTVWPAKAVVPVSFALYLAVVLAKSLLARHPPDHSFEAKAGV